MRCRGKRGTDDQCHRKSGVIKRKLEAQGTNPSLSFSGMSFKR